jgi:hypothetical protein
MCWSKRFLLVFCVALALFGLVYPVYVIRPFRAQGQTELQIALFVLRYRFFAEAASLIAAVLTVTFVWRAAATRTRIAGGIAALLVAAFALLSKVNPYEIMFHPVGQPDFGRVADSRLGEKERVLAVSIGGAARAYPIRNLAYHHLVNDNLGGVPIVPTY